MYTVLPQRRRLIYITVVQRGEQLKFLIAFCRDGHKIKTERDKKYFLSTVFFLSYLRWFIKRVTVPDWITRFPGASLPAINSLSAIKAFLPSIFLIYLSDNRYGTGPFFREYLGKWPVCSVFLLLFSASALWLPGPHVSPRVSLYSALAFMPTLSAIFIRTGCYSGALQIIVPSNFSSGLKHYHNPAAQCARQRHFILHALWLRYAGRLAIRG